MAGRRFFGSGKNVLSGAQPTYASLGKAKGPKKGTKRAKAGGRVRRADAFPEEGGRVLLDSSDEDAEEMSSKGRVASSSAASRARALAASSRSSFSRSSALTGDRHALPAADLEELDEQDFENVSDVSTHASDEEDSEDPDREVERGREGRWVEKVRERKRAEAKKDVKGKGKEKRLFRDEADEGEEEEEDEATRLRKARLARFDSVAPATQVKKEKGTSMVINLALSSSSDEAAHSDVTILLRSSPGRNSDRRASSTFSHAAASPTPSSPPTVKLWTRHDPGTHSQTLSGLKKQREKERREQRAAAKRAEAVRNGEVVVPPARKKKKGVEGEGRRLCDEEGDEEREALREIEEFLARGGEAKVGEETGKGKGKGRKERREEEVGREKKKRRLFNRSSDDEDDHSDELEDSDLDLPGPSSLLSRTKKRTSPSASASASTSRSTLTADSSSRAARRARTSKHAHSDVEEMEESGEEVVIDTGGVGGIRSFKVGTRAKKGKEAEKGQGKEEPAKNQAPGTTGKGKKRVRPDSSASSDNDLDPSPSAASSTDSDALSRLVRVPPLSDPRAELRRRRLRELSDPPTDAFSSSDGEGESEEEATVGGKKGKGRKEEEVWDRMEKRMKGKKREYRENKGPGYSNPRRN